jgi:hypothetical protein
VFLNPAPVAQLITSATFVGVNMQLLDIAAVGSDHVYRWPDGSEEPYPHWIEYRAIGTDREHRVRIGFGLRHTYGQDRKRIVVWIDSKVQAEFLAADDFEHSGDVLCEIKVPGDSGERICRYPEESIPERYSGLPVVGLPTRVGGKGVHHAWAVVANIADHRVLFALAALRRLERER